MQFTTAATVYIPFLLLFTTAASVPTIFPPTIYFPTKDCSRARLQRRGAALSCFKRPLDPRPEPPWVEVSQPPAGPTSQPSAIPPLQPPAFPASQPPAPPPASLVTSQLTCTLPANLARYTPDCYCTSAFTIKCDKCLAQMHQTLLDLRFEPAQATVMGQHMVQILEEWARRVCRCGTALERIPERQRLGRGVR